MVAKAVSICVVRIALEVHLEAQSRLKKHEVPIEAVDIDVNETAFVSMIGCLLRTPARR